MYLRMSAVDGKWGPVLCIAGLDPATGDRGELTDGWECFRVVWPPKTEGCDRLLRSACRVESVMESVDIDVTELCLALLLIEDDAMLGLLDPKLDSELPKKFAPERGRASCWLCWT